MLKKRHLSFCSYSLNLKTANLKTHENKQTKVHVLMGVDYLCLSMCKGAWRFLRLKISNRWSRLIFLYNMHIGKMIEEELRRQERTVTWLAKHLCCERTNVYSIFKRESIDTILLFRISIILKKNFFMLPYKETEEQIRKINSTDM